MQLNDGVCNVCSWSNGANPGEKPIDTWGKLFDAWYKDLEFVSIPAYQTEHREDQQIDRKIRILHEPAARDARAVQISDITYRIIRVFAGTDDESGERILDISLRRWDDG